MNLCKRAVAKGIDVFKVLKAACINPVKHYNMNVGLLKEGDDADFIVVKDLKNFEVIANLYKWRVGCRKWNISKINAPESSVDK